jgi:predicted ferric reductase
MSGKNNLLIILIAFFSLTPAFTHATVKDSDMDGLTDQAETDVYRTDLNNYDTDGDGIADGYEVTDGTNPLDANSAPFPTIGNNTIQTVSMSWYIGRAAGIVAFIVLSIVVMNGLLITTRLVFKLLPPALNYEMHTFLAWLGLGMTALHVGALTFDTYFKLRWVEIFVPFSLERSFLSGGGFNLTWATGIGSLALYGILLLIVSSKLKGRIVNIRAWRLLHYASFLTYLLFLFHGIFSGTDTRTWWMTWVYGVSATTILGLTIMRIYISIQKLSSKQTSPTSS